MAGFYLGRLPESDGELYEVVRAMWGVTIPRTRVCLDHVAPFTAFADAYFGRNSINPEAGHDSKALWHGSRGLSGKSMALSILGLTKAVLLGADCNLLGGSMEQSTNIHKHMRAALYSDNAPRFMLTVETSTLVQFANKANIRPLTASQKSVRGPHPPFLLCDEIDEMDQPVLDAALGQPMPQRNYLGEIIKPYAVLCSTWQHPEGTFATTIRQAEEDGFPVYRWCYRESANPVDGWLTQEAIAEKKRSIPAAAWASEYELDEPSIGNRAFDTDAIDAAFSLPGLPLAEKVSKDFEEYTYAAPIKTARYVCCADWAKERDYTVIAVGRIDVHPHQLVYYMKVNRRPYPTMVGYFNTAMERYHASAEHDGTGLGNVINDYLNTTARSFIMTGEKRAKMLSEYISAVERGDWRFPKITSAYLAHKFCRVGDIYTSAAGFHLPDEVCAFALMQHMVTRHVRPASPIVVRRDGTPSALERMFTPTKEPQGQVVSGRERSAARGGYELSV